MTSPAGLSRIRNTCQTELRLSQTILLDATGLKWPCEGAIGELLSEPARLCIEPQGLRDRRMVQRDQVSCLHQMGPSAMSTFQEQSAQSHWIHTGISATRSTLS